MKIYQPKFRRNTWTSGQIALAVMLLMICAWSSGAQTNTFPSTGSAGVGTTNPTQKLDVVGNILLDSAGNWYGINKASGEARAVMFNGALLSDPDYVYFGSLNNGFKFVDSSNSPLVTIQNGGNVGIGTTSPAQKLHVVGVSRFDAARGVNALILHDSTANADAWSGFFDSSSSNFHFYNRGSVGNLILSTTDSAYLMNGNVGIGTTSPGERLDVSGTFRASGQNSAPTSGAGVEISYGGGVGYIQSYDRATSNRPLHISGSSVQLNAGGEGNVGIGTSSPGYKLDVNGNTNITGNITASGTINAKYQDVAEWVPSSEQLSAGTVVVLDSTKSNQVTSSSVSYDTRVAGVVSEQPGIALGEKSESKVLVATTGRVRAKVDASKGAIHIGDLLVTSDIPGVAMKSEPVEFAGRKMHMPGTLIGKALEPLEKGKGEILVLLSLQ